MYGCELDHKEGWVLKSWCFWTEAQENTLESPLDCKDIKPKGNQSWIFTGRTDVEPKLQYFGHLMKRADSLKKTLMLGKIEGRRRRGRQRMRWLGGITDSMDMSLSKFQEWWRTGKPGLMQSVGLQNQKRLSDWTTLLLLQALCLCGSTHPISLKHFKPKWKKKNAFLKQNTEKHKEKK